MWGRSGLTTSPSSLSSLVQNGSGMFKEITVIFISGSASLCGTDSALWYWFSCPLFCVHFWSLTQCESGCIFLGGVFSCVTPALITERKLSFICCNRSVSGPAFNFPSSILLISCVLPLLSPLALLLPANIWYLEIIKTYSF